ncbi:hypothetical protein Q3G72_016912 [Acer saccharum]|nr:hypothetical protein Q3G72_016912 [Acer saccharum]
MQLIETTGDCKNISPEFPEVDFGKQLRASTTSEAWESIAPSPAALVPTAVSIVDVTGWSLAQNHFLTR